MTKTTKRYLLPSEIDGVLRRGEPVFLSIRSGEFKFEWSAGAGMLKYVLQDCTWYQTVPISFNDRMHHELRSYNCHALVRVCECGEACDMSGKCHKCDDPFS